MARLSSRKAKKRKKNLQGMAILALIGAVVIAFLYIRSNMIDQRVVLNTETLCPEDGPVALTAILIDGTDSFSPIQYADLSRYLQAIKADARQYEQVSIFAPRTVQPESLLEPDIVVCNPGTEEGRSGLTENLRQIRKRYEDGYSKQLDATLLAVLEVQPANQSPIMEMIQAVAISTFPVTDDGRPRKLIIVSDMLQNTVDYSQYRGNTTFDTIKSSGWFQHVSTPLTGVDVEILYISREGSESLQTREHLLFWEKYFKHLGASLVSVIRIGG